MFHNTTGGDYKDNNSKVTYTFPVGAAIEISNVRIPLDAITVECYGESYDTDTIEYFTNSSALLTPKISDTYNTSIFINDHDISGSGYPERYEFIKHGIEYISYDDFIKFQRKVINERLPTHKLNRMIDFIQRLAESNRKKIFDKIQKIIKSNSKFPKNISVIYDDRKLKHTSHIILSFTSPDQCVLCIDNTLSPLFTFQPDKLSSLANEFKLNPYECSERVADDQSNVIELYADIRQEPRAKLVLKAPINQLFVSMIYNRMREMISKIGIQIIDVKIYHSRHNQKNTSECVPFAIQNKLDYITGNGTNTSETARQKGIRLRTEHAVISILLNGGICIPRHDDQRANDHGVKYDNNSWYPNISEVCISLYGAIADLSFTELSRLYLSLEIDEASKLSSKFAALLLHAMKDQLPNDEYKAITETNVDQDRADFIERTMAPGVFYNKKKQSIYISKALLFSIEKRWESNSDNKRHEIKDSIEREIVDEFRGLHTRGTKTGSNRP